MPNSLYAVETMSDAEPMNAHLLDWFRNASALFCHHQLDGKILAVNAPLCRATGYSENALLRMNLRDLLDPAKRDQLPEYLATVRNGSASGQMLIRTASGETRIWAYDNVLVGSTPPTVCGVGRDVTGEDKEARALQTSEQHYRMLVERNPDVIMILSPQGELRYHSPSANDALRLQYRPEPILGCTLSKFIHEEDRPAFDAAIQRMVAAGEAVERIDARLQRTGGDYRSFEIILSTVVKRGRVERIIVNARDVTERKMLEQQLEQANRLSSLGRLAATVAHEFNNVLMGMMPFAELLRRDNLKPELIQTSTGHILTSIQRGKRVALDVLRFTQPAEPTLGSLSLDQWWDRFLPEVVAIFGNHIRVESNVQPVTIAADSMQLTQLFSNLISNAKDAMSTGGKLTVSTRMPRAGEVYSFGVVSDPQRFVQITVRDTGDGIPPDLIRHVFDPLFTTKRNGGTGLGLAVAHHVVTRHGGHIFVESEVGVGTAFHVFLPKFSLDTHDDRDGASESTAKPSMRTVLLVDDEPLIVDGVVALLEMEGFDVRVAATGKEALQQIEQSVPDFVVLDIGLPDIDGIEVGRRIRAAHPHLPILFATGHGDSRAIPRDPRTALLRKPFQLSELLARVAGLERGESS